MSRPTLLRASLALALLSAGAGAQIQVVPSDHVLTIPRGKVGVIKVLVKDGCTPTWDLDLNGNTETWFDIFGDAPGPSKARTYKFRANGPVGGFTTATIFLEGVAAGCAEDETLRVRMLITEPGKVPEKIFIKGDSTIAPAASGAAPRLKAFRGNVKQATKNLATDVKEILALHLAQALPQLPGGVFTQDELAAQRFFDEQADTLDDLYLSYWLTLTGMARDGATALINSGYASETTNLVEIAGPSSLKPGTGGLWDQWKQRLVAELQRTSPLFGAIEARFLRQLRAQAVAQGRPFFVHAAPLALRDPGDGGISPVSGANTIGFPDLDANKTTQVLQLRGWNQAAAGGTNLSKGRIQVLGRVGSTDAVLLTFQRLAFDGSPLGNSQGDVFPVNETTCTFRVTWPEVDSNANLAPGTWRVTASGGGANIATGLVTVPGN